MIIVVIAIIAVISVGLSLISLRREMRRSQHEEKVAKDLAKGKVLFYSPSDSDSAESSSK